jgi:acyl-CoA synthetase (AMP-forming)/AMP-acid ligase II
VLLSPKTAAQYGVDTGDMVELEDGRYYFRGRIGGVINVGGQKVYPEEVEAVIGYKG